MRKLAVEAIFAITQEVMDAWVIDPTHMLLSAGMLILAPRKWKVLFTAQTWQKVHLFVEIALFTIHGSTIIKIISIKYNCHLI
jgi:hypothetical protein